MKEGSLKEGRKEGWKERRKKEKGGSKQGVHGALYRFA